MITTPAKTMKRTPWKTYLGAIMGILGAVVGMYNGTTDIGTGISTIGAGLTALGFRHAIDVAIKDVLAKVR